MGTSYNYICFQSLSQISTFLLYLRNVAFMGVSSRRNCSELICPFSTRGPFGIVPYDKKKKKGSGRFPWIHANDARSDQCTKKNSLQHCPGHSTLLLSVAARGTQSNCFNVYNLATSINPQLFHMTQCQDVQSFVVHLFIFFNF